jgi:hypothetical protein
MLRAVERSGTCGVRLLDFDHDLPGSQPAHSTLAYIRRVPPHLAAFGNWARLGLKLWKEDSRGEPRTARRAAALSGE